MHQILNTASGLETKFVALDQKACSGADIAGYASFFGAADQNADVVEPGAFAASLERLSREGRTVKLLWQHDPAKPIGVWDEVAEDRLGLAVRGRLLTEVRCGAEAAALLAAGAIDGLSIGYRTVRAERAGKGRRLLELDLWEVSLVTFPMLPSARASTALPAADADADAAREFSEALRAARAMFA